MSKGEHRLELDARVAPAIGAGSTAMMSCTSWASVPAAKGGLPAAHSYMMHPSAHRSLAVLCGPFWNSSGAMYAGEALFACAHTGFALNPFCQLPVLCLGKGNAEKRHRDSKENCLCGAT